MEKKFIYLVSHVIPGPLCCLGQLIFPRLPSRRRRVRCGNQLRQNKEQIYLIIHSYLGFLSSPDNLRNLLDLRLPRSLVTFKLRHIIILFNH